VEQVACALARVELVETLPYSMSFDPNNRVLLGVEDRSTAEGLHRDLKFGHVIDSSKEFVANILKESAGIGLAGKEGRRQYRFILSQLGGFVGCQHAAPQAPTLT
jgi:hypothetical protein